MWITRISNGHNNNMGIADNIQPKIIPKALEYTAKQIRIEIQIESLITQLDQ